MEKLYKLQSELMLRVEKSKVNFKKSSTKDRQNPTFIDTKLELLEVTWNNFVKNHERIVIDVSEENRDDKYFRDEIYEKTEDMYTDYKSYMRELLCKLRGNDSPATPASSNQHVKTKTDSIKLPKITIQEFSGDYARWPTFKDLFVSLIHQNESLDNVQKMHYLKGLLSGEAEQLVRNIPTTSANYDECWKLLSSRFDNKRYISNCLLKRLMSQINVAENSTAIKSLLDTTMECLNGLKNLEINTDSWDIIVIYIVSLKLDIESRKQWETKISSHDKLPTLDEFREFLEARSRALEFLDSKSIRPRPIVSKPRVHHVVSADNNANENMSCSYCKESHKIANCKQFAKESYESRQDFVQTKGLCFNCLGSGHSIRYCHQNSSCKVCKRRHHSLLHPRSAPDSAVFNRNSTTAEVKSAVSDVQESLAQSEPSTSNVASHFSRWSRPTQVLLATALVEAQTRRGSNQLLRVLLDQGSQASFITESAVQLLGLKKKPSSTVISGIGGEKSSFASEVTVSVTIHSRVDPQFSVQVETYVLSTITSLLPSEKLAESIWPEFQIELADPEYHTPNKIDILLGAEVYSQVLREGLTQGPPGFPVVAQNTALGWILSGQIPSKLDKKIHCHHAIIGKSEQVDDNALLKQFWEKESVIPGSLKILSVDEQRCEDIYTQTTSTDESGRYVVYLPSRSDDPQCQYGGCRELAVKRLQLLEGKFKKHPEVKERYSEVFQEHIQLGHIEQVQQSDDPERESAVYLPHHAVVCEAKSTTKVRMVFDASMKGLNGVSRNDDLMVGPTLQPSLRHVMKWRMKLKVLPEHVEPQRVVWHDDPKEERNYYSMPRVTFDTSSAPYLAVKTQEQVAVDKAAHCPEETEIRNEINVMTGCRTIKEGQMLKKEMTEVLTKRGFQMQKRVSSCKELDEKISDVRKDRKEEKDQEQGIKEKNIRTDDVMKTLGISRDRECDELRYAVKLTAQQTPITKRRIISDILRLLDPLGWAAPCVVTSKIFMQKLWLSGIGWDQELPPELLVDWQTYRQNHEDTRKFSLPRCVQTSVENLCVDLHDFSEAAVYVKIVDANKSICTSLVIACTRVAPVDEQSSPRRKLMGATLLTDLITEIVEVIKIPHAHIHAWTDSSGVLAWLRGHPSRWITFVENRVSVIRSQFDDSHWAHVQSSHNPADTEDPVRIMFSTLTKLMRVIVYYRRVMRWRKRENERCESYLTREEIEEATKVCIRQVQKKEVREEMEDLRKIKPVKVRTKLKSCCTIIDDDGIMRVSGRIQNAKLDEGITHPIIDIWRDNATNFVGSAKELGHLVAAERSSVAEEFRAWLGNNGTDRNYEKSNICSLKCWPLSQRMMLGFWRRWSEEYLVHLLQRYKWNKHVPEPNIGDFVLVKEDNLPSARWLLDRIVEKLSGSDKVTRVATLKCNGSLCKRPVSRLCVLPVTD